MSKSKLGALGGNEAGHIISSGLPSANNMTGTATIGPVVLNIDEADEITFDAVWTGNPTGTWLVEVSNSLLPNGKDQNGTPIRAGSWNSVVALVDGTMTNPAGSAGKAIFGFKLTNFVMGFTYLRISYTNATGAGALDVYMSGKAVG